MSDSPARYYPINNAEEEASEKLLGSSSISLQQPRRPESRFLWHWIAHAVLLCSTIGLLFANLRPTTTGCAKKLSTFSPALDVVKYEPIKFNGTLAFPSIYRGPPSPEIDAAWNRVSRDMKMIRLPKDSLRQIGKDDRPSLVRFRDEDGGGYMMSLEVGHQLHCLNMLRKNTYFDYYEKQDSSIQEDPGFYRLHLDHCIEMLRQNLMCTADVGLISFDWVQGRKKPYPDFNTQHVCRNFEELINWNAQNAAHVPVDNLVRIGDETDLESLP